MAIYDDLLETIRQRAGEYKYIGSRQPACPGDALNALRRRTSEELGRELPEQYAQFLAKADGLYWNGLVFYASERAPLVYEPDQYVDGFVEANLEQRLECEGFNGFLLFGCNDVVFYTFCITESEYQVISNTGLSVAHSFKTFDELLFDALEFSL